MQSKSKSKQRKRRKTTKDFIVIFPKYTFLHLTILPDIFLTYMLYCLAFLWNNDSNIKINYSLDGTDMSSNKKQVERRHFSFQIKN